MAKMAQQVLLSVPEKQDIMTLAVLRQESQAEIVRLLIAHAKTTFLRAQAGQVTELFAAFEAMNIEPLEALTEMLAVKLRADGVRRPLTLVDLRSADGKWRKRFPRGTAAAA